MTIRYMHYRPYSSVFDANIVAIDTVEGKGGLTIAYVEDAEKGTIEFASAICHENDNFNRKLGRDIAEGRLKSGRLVNEVFEGDYKAFIEEMDDLVNSTYGYYRARQIAQGDNSTIH